MGYYENREDLEETTDVAAIPWLQRDPRSLEDHLVPPVSSWGRGLYWMALPFVVLLVALLIAMPY